METWWPQILNFLHLRVTNARTEGYNRTIKTIKRVSVNRLSAGRLAGAA
jgi:transposase